VRYIRHLGVALAAVVALKPTSICIVTANQNPRLGTNISIVPLQQMPMEVHWKRQHRMRKVLVKRLKVVLTLTGWCFSP
jgi:hypothetical protein